MTQKKWFATEGYQTRKGTFGVRFYKAGEKIYPDDVELSPSPWLHSDFFKKAEEAFFTSRDIAYGEILQAIREMK